MRTSADPSISVDSQGKRRGDPGADPKTVEPIKELRQRLWSFWDERFSPSGPSQAGSDSPPNGSRSGAEQQMLYVSHGAAIREFITSLVEMADRKERDFELVLPADEAEMIRTGSKRIDNCSRTVIEMEWLDQDTGMCLLVGLPEIDGVLTKLRRMQLRLGGEGDYACTLTTRTLSTRAARRALPPTPTWWSRVHLLQAYRLQGRVFLATIGRPKPGNRPESRQRPSARSDGPSFGGHGMEARECCASCAPAPLASGGQLRARIRGRENRKLKRAANDCAEGRAPSPSSSRTCPRCQLRQGPDLDSEHLLLPTTDSVARQRCTRRATVANRDALVGNRSSRSASLGIASSPHTPHGGTQSVAGSSLTLDSELPLDRLETPVLLSSSSPSSPPPPPPHRISADQTLVRSARTADSSDGSDSDPAQRSAECFHQTTRQDLRL